MITNLDAIQEYLLSQYRTSVIECPICGETFEPKDLTYEFSFRRSA